MNRVLIRSFFISILLIMNFAKVSAQCGSENNAFSSGEILSYDLYYNWKFIWVKAGNASLSTVQSVYKGKPAYRASLITRGNKNVDDIFVLRDTLLCYTGTDLVPKYFRKGAREGSRYTVDEVWYSYTPGKCNIRQHFMNNNHEHRYKNKESSNCIFDMMSMLLRARSFNVDGFKPGHKIYLPLADGDDMNNALLIYRGKEKFKMENQDITFRCLVFSYMDTDKDKEIIRFYVTDDDNHIPVRLDMFLNFGVAKAYISGMRNIRNPLTSKVK
jgi:hypothetical protein